MRAQLLLPGSTLSLSLCPLTPVLSLSAQEAGCGQVYTRPLVVVMLQPDLAKIITHYIKPTGLNL